MKKLSAEERLNTILHGQYREKLPNDDKGMFIFYAGILVALDIFSFSERISNLGFIEYDLKTKIPKSDAKYYAKEAKKAVADYICEVNGFKGWNKEKSFLDWYHQMMTTYEKNVEEWAGQIRQNASELIPIFIAVGKIPCKNHGHMMRA